MQIDALNNLNKCFFCFQLEEAKLLVRDAITAGIFCDLGSGSNVDLCVITQSGVKYLRGYDKPTAKGQRSDIIYTFLFFSLEYSGVESSSETNDLFSSLCVFFSREGQYRYKPGTTGVLTKTVTPLSLDVVDESVQIMDTE